MPKSVSVPEKTLEHWSSQYINYRYKTKAAQWWPAFREDIRVEWLPARPGIAVLLELKTTTTVNDGIHDVWVDLVQLREYLKQPLWRQPFYALPHPDECWPAKLDEAAAAAGLHVTQLGFRRSDSWWFANWMVVMPAAEVGKVLRKELAAYGSATRRTKKRLVRFDVREKKNKKDYAAWGHSGKEPAPEWMNWLDFWSTLEQCGRPGWPQLIRLPRLAIRDRKINTSSELLAWLQEFADAGDFEADQIERDRLITLESGLEGNYEVVDDGDGRSAGHHAANEAVDHRQFVFLDARAFLPGQQAERAGDADAVKSDPQHPVRTEWTETREG